MKLHSTVLIMTPRQQPAKSLNEITETRCVLGMPATLESQILLKISCWLQSVFYFWRADGVGWTAWLIWFSLLSFSHRMQQFTGCSVRCPAVPSVAEWQDLQNILLGSEVDCCSLWCNQYVLNMNANSCYRKNQIRCCILLYFNQSDGCSFDCTSVWCTLVWPDKFVCFDFRLHVRVRVNPYLLYLLYELQNY